MTSGLVAVTGGTGFLGRRIVEHLLSTGRGVRVLARDPTNAEGWRRGVPVVIDGSLDDAKALSRLVDDVEAVIHVAGLIKAHDRSEFFAVNENGTRQVALACKGRRLIHVSSLAAREPSLSDYAASKLAGELAIKQVGCSAATIVRPPVVYGPGDRETLALFQAARRGVVPVPGDRRARLALADADDVAEVVVDLIDVPRPPPMITIGGDRPLGYEWSEIVAAAARAVGSKAAAVAVPPWAMTLAGGAVELLDGWLGRTPIFTRGKAREAAHRDWSVSRSEEGITAERRYKGLDAGFARTVAWYRAAGWLD